MAAGHRWVGVAVPEIPAAPMRSEDALGLGNRLDHFPGGTQLVSHSDDTLADGTRVKPR